jgi:UDP-N-acetylglucosamine 2-epimerase (non-hydrolysing)
MKKILLVFGTRPEAIKMAPLVRRFREASDVFRVKVAVTAQHRRLLDQVLELFEVVPDYDLNLMTPDQDLFEVTAGVMTGLKKVLYREKPDLILVHGDTTTAFAAALAAFYCGIPVGHVEAGLRTRHKRSPFPEEMNRHLTGAIADYHFAPTQWARKNLLAEAVPADRIWVTGNTVIDALRFIAQKVRREEAFWHERLSTGYNLHLDGRRLVLVTGHRRENFGRGLQQICLALRDLMEHHADLHLVFPVHLNPHAQRPVYEILAEQSQTCGQSNGSVTVETTGGGRLSLLPPLEYAPFMFLMSKCHLVLTDSGGIQEEAPALGKPVLVMRETTERPEVLWSGAAQLVGANRKQIFQAVTDLLENPVHYQAMAQARNPYGDGRASEKIVQVLKNTIHHIPGKPAFRRGAPRPPLTLATALGSTSLPAPP